MADDTSAPADASQEAEQAPSEPQQPDIPAEVKAALRKANKEAESLRLKLKEYEDAQKTEQQKLEERAAAAERAAAEREAELLRYRVGAAKGLPADLIDRLRGANEEELLADADKLLSLLPPAPRVNGAVDQGARSDLSAALNGDPLIRDLKSKLGIT